MRKTKKDKQNGVLFNNGVLLNLLALVGWTLFCMLGALMFIGLISNASVTQKLLYLAGMVFAFVIAGELYKISKEAKK
jgi:hypothetical protein